MQHQYGPAPFWTWAGNITPEKIDRDLKRFRDMEIYELVIMPLYGLVQPYLGRDYLRLYEHACKRCRQYDQKIWIYDEFNWPSGTCAGKVLREHPEARKKIIRFEFPGIGQSGQPTWKIEEYAGFDLAAYGSEWSLNSTGYLDTLSAPAVGHYIRMTHEAYRDAIGGYFRDVILGFFTDEPVLLRAGRALPFTPGLFELFRQRYGYDLEKNILGLVTDTPLAPRLRRDYWALVTELFKINFFRQYAGWCGRHGLQMTGHLLYEEMLSGQVQFNGDVYDTLAEMQAPGIDMLQGLTSFDRRGLRDAFGGEACADITGKLIESVGFFAGKQRLLCEVCGVTAHSGTAQFYKRAMDYLFHHGISLMNDNLFADSQGGFRSGFGCHSFWTPWTRHYKLLSRHVCAMSRLNSGSRLETNLGILYPRQDLWRRFGPPGTFHGSQPPEPAWHATQQTFLNLTHGLIRRHWNYYYVFEQALARAEFPRHGMQIDGFECRALILPDLYAVSETDAAMLKRFLDNGGCLICAQRRPLIFGADGRTRAATWLRGPRVFDVRCGMSELADRTARMLEKIAPRKVAISGDHTDAVMLTHRHARGREWVFLTNFGEQAADVRTNLDGHWRLAEPGGMADAGKSPRRFLLLPNESVLFARTDRKAPALPAPAQSGTAMRLPAEWSFRLPQGNTLNLPLQIFSGACRGKFPPAAGGKWSAPFAEIAPFDLLPGHTYWLRAELNIEGISGGLHLIADGRDQCEVFLNRRRAAGHAGRPLWDDANLTFNLPGCARPGKHEILIRYTPHRERKYASRFWPLTSLPPFVLAGGFVVDPKRHREGFRVLRPVPKIMPLGDLFAMGLPGIAGLVEYSTTVNLSRQPRQMLLDLGAQRDTFEVVVNGRDAGALLWPPYRLEIGGLIKKGRNRITLRLRTAMSGILSNSYRKLETSRPPVGLLEIPMLVAGD